LAIRQNTGQVESGIYLPAFGKELKSSTDRSRGGRFLGTDFTIEDMTAEILSDYRYIRVADQKIDKADHFVVEAFPQDTEIEQTTGYGLRRHFIQKDIFFIVRTDYYGPRGRFLKRQTQHDLKRVSGEMWRANMILMDNHKEQHKTLIKINRRVFSHDYVPPQIFTTAWLLENKHIQGTEKRLFQDTSQSAAEDKETMK